MVVHNLERYTGRIGTGGPSFDLLEIESEDGDDNDWIPRVLIPLFVGFKVKYFQCRILCNGFGRVKV